MKSVSFWAKRNTAKARLLIALSETLLFVLAVKLGLLLLQAGIQLPGMAVLVPICISGIALFLYRYRSVLAERGKKQYLRQRLCFFLVGFSMFLTTTFLVSSEKMLSWNAFSPLCSSGFTLLVKPAPTAGNQITAAQAKKAMHLLKKMRKHAALNWLYVFLVIVGGLVLLYAIAILACSLSCNGNGALAWVVVLLGGGGVIFLCAWLIRKILSGKSRDKTQTAPATVPMGTA